MRAIHQRQFRSNVLMLSADYPPRAWSGIAAAVETQARALAAMGVNVSVLTRQAPPAASGEPGLSVRGLDEPVFPFRRVEFDWIHLHSLPLTELAFELRRRTGARLAYTAHSLMRWELDQCGEQAFWTRLQLRVMRESDAPICLSESERRAALALAPELQGRIRVIGNGLPPPAPAPARDGVRGPVVFAGRLTAGKGLELVRELFPRIRQQWSGSFVVAGGHGDAEGELLLSELRRALGGSLRTPGWLSREELDRLYRSAALVVVPSRYEPFGMVALEAMRMGAPVLAANVGGLAEIVTEHSGGRLVASRNPEEWCAAALEIVADPAAARELGMRGPAYVASHFPADGVAQRLLREVYAN